jgi:uncharacterized membrane protein YesL
MFHADAWGLDAKGAFKTNQTALDRSSYNCLQRLYRRIGKVARSALLQASETSDVAERVLADLKDVHLALMKEEAIEHLNPRSEKELGKRLLYLFQRDLLPGLSGEILESKKNRDIQETRAVAWQTKLVCWLFVILLNACMLAYVLIYFANQEKHRQQGWARSLFVWLASDIAVVTTLTVVLMHVWIPSLIISDVANVKRRLAERIRLFNARTFDRTDNEPPIMSARASFDATRYLFVSTRLAERWPMLKESQIILEFHTTWKQSYQREANVGEQYSLRYTALFRSISVLVVGIMQLRNGVQDTIVQWTSTVAAGGVALLHAMLYEMHPALVALPAVVVCGCVSVSIYCCLRREKPTEAAAEIDEEIGAELEEDIPSGRVVPFTAELGMPPQRASSYRVVSPRTYMGQAQAMRQGSEVLRALQLATAEPAADTYHVGAGATSYGPEEEAVRVFEAERDLPGRAVLAPVHDPRIAARRRLSVGVAGTGDIPHARGKERFRSWMEAAGQTLSKEPSSPRIRRLSITTSAELPACVPTPSATGATAAPAEDPCVVTAPSAAAEPGGAPMENAWASSPQSVA